MLLMHRFALDLYKNQLLDVNLPFTNPFRWTTMVGYNHKNKVSNKDVFPCHVISQITPSTDANETFVSRSPVYTLVVFKTEILHECL
jgi:hypothetical protein